MEHVYTKEELAEKAHRTMADNELTEIYATEDGQLFYDENRAKLHASQNDLKLFSYTATKKNNPKSK